MAGYDDLIAAASPSPTPSGGSYSDLLQATQGSGGGGYQDLLDATKPTPSPAKDNVAPEATKALGESEYAAHQNQTVAGTDAPIFPMRREAVMPETPAWALEIQKPISAVGKALVSQIPTSREAVESAATMMTGPGPDPVKWFTEAAKGGVALAGHMQNVQKTKPFSQEWWDSVAPLAIAMLSEEGVGFGAKVKPPVQTGEVIPSATKNQISAASPLPTIGREPADRPATQQTTQGIAQQEGPSAEELTPKEVTPVEEEISQQPADRQAVAGTEGQAPQVQVVIPTPEEGGGIVEKEEGKRPDAAPVSETQPAFGGVEEEDRDALTGTGPAAAPVGPASDLSRQIGRTTGVIKPREAPQPIRQFQALKALYSAAQKAGTAGYQRGIREGRAVTKQALTELKQQLGMADRWMAGDQEQVRQNMVDFVNTVLPPEERGRFINRITQALRRPALGKEPDVMYRQAFDVMQDIADRAENVWKRDLKNQIGDLHNDIMSSPSVSVEMKEQARKYFGGINYQNLSVEELEAMAQDAQQMREIGRQQVKDTKEAQTQDFNMRAADLANSPTKPVSGIAPIARDLTPRGWKAYSDKIYNGVAKALDWASLHEKARLFIPRLFETLDGSPNGWLTRNVYEPFVIRHNQFLTKFNPLRDGAREIADRNSLKEEDFQRVGIHAHLMQGHTVDELMKFAADKPARQKLIDDVMNNGLTKGQQELYDYGRTYFTNQIDPMKKFFADNYNQELTLYDNYWPREIDPRKRGEWQQARNKWVHPATGQVVDIDNVAQGLWSTMDRGQWRTRQVAKGFGTARVPEAEIPVNLNAMETLLNHMENWSYVEHMQPHLNTVGKLANTNLFQTKYGPHGQGMVLDYIDALARRARYSRRGYEKVLDGLRNRTMVGTLGFRLNQFKHLANYPVGIQEAGGALAWEDGFSSAWTDRGQAFLKRVFPEIGEAMGGDISIKEAAEIGKKSRAAFVIDRVLDYRNRSAIAIGRYKAELKALGLNKNEFDTLPVNPKALVAARQAYVNAVGGVSILDRPLLLTKGTSIGSKSVAKAIFAYQSPKLARWGQVRSALVEDAWRGGKYGKAATKLTATGIGSLMEAGIKWGSRAAYSYAAYQILQAMGFNAYRREHDVPAAHQLLNETISDLTSLVPGGSVVGKGIAIREYPRAKTDILKETGVPPIDTFVATMADLYGLSAHPTSQDWLKAGQDALQLAGVPVSTVTSVTREMQKQSDPKKQRAADIAQLRKDLNLPKGTRLGGKGSAQPAF